MYRPSRDSPRAACRAALVPPRRSSRAKTLCGERLRQTICQQRESYARLCLKAIASAADVHSRASFRVFLDLTQNLVGDGRGVALAEYDVLQKVLERVALAPAEIDVRNFAR